MSEDQLACRHCHAPWEYEWEYCPQCERNYGGARYPATQTDAELRAIESLIALIRHTFSEVRLGKGTTIHEADLEGAYTDPAVRDHARSKDMEERWEDVPDWKLEHHASAISFLDPEGWRFYLPALMVWSLRFWRTTERTTADAVINSLTLSEAFPQWSRDRYQTLNLPQSATVLRFLKFFDAFSPGDEPRTALASYWSQFEPPTSAESTLTRP